MKTREEKLAYMKQWRIDNADSIKAKRKAKYLTPLAKKQRTEYYEKNRDKINSTRRKNVERNKEYYKAYHKEYAKKHLEEQRARDRKRNDANKTRFHQFLADKSCIICGESHKACLQFHHRDPSTKKHNVAKMVNKHFAWSSILDEISKCDILCANCHFKHHWNKRYNLAG